MLGLSSNLTNFGDWLSGTLAKRPDSYSAIASYLQNALPDFQTIQRDRVSAEARGLDVIFKKDQDSIVVPFERLSDGEKCYFVLAAALAANEAYGPLLCIWDEPDNHLSLSEIGQFITSMRKTAKSGGQFIATSHHPETVRKFSDDNTFVLTRKSHLDPTLSRLLRNCSYNGDLIDALIRDEVIG